MTDWDLLDDDPHARGMATDLRADLAGPGLVLRGA